MIQRRNISIGFKPTFWSSLIKNGQIEILDTFEEESMRIATYSDELYQKNQDVTPNFSEMKNNETATTSDLKQKIDISKDKIDISKDKIDISKEKTEQNDFIEKKKKASLVNYATHCEVVSESILSYSASVIPFPDHNQSPRVAYQTAMCKQAQSLGSTVPDVRVDSSGQSLW